MDLTPCLGVKTSAPSELVQKNKILMILLCGVEVAGYMGLSQLSCAEVVRCGFP